MNNYIKSLQLEKHIEGGYFRRIVTSDIKVARGATYHPACSAIYYLLEKENFSAWHRINADEIWHYYDGGSTVKIHRINSLGEYQYDLLGRLDQRGRFQIAIPANTWFAAELIDKTSFALMGCTVAPAFDYRHFEFAQADKLIEQYPDLSEIIFRLCRN